MKNRKLLIGGGSAAGLIALACICCTVFGLISPDSTPIADRATRTPTSPLDSLPATDQVSRLLPENTPTLKPAPTSTPIPTATPLPIPTPIPTDTPTPSPEAHVTTTETVNLRSGPGTNYDQVGTLQPDQTLPIIGRTADSSWWQVKTPSGPAWVAASVVTAINTDDTIPVVETSPLEPLPTATTTPISPAPTLPPVSQCPQGCEAQQAGCDIKGNINRENEKIYHAPGWRDYNKTEIDPSNGERWFCTEQEAVANGWRAAQQ
jgi:hypothetical protein